MFGFIINNIEKWPSITKCFPASCANSSSPDFSSPPGRHMEPCGTLWNQFTGALFIHASHSPQENKIIQVKLNLRKAYKIWNYLSTCKASCNEKTWCTLFLGFWISNSGDGLKGPFHFFFKVRDISIPK